MITILCFVLGITIGYFACRHYLYKPTKHLKLMDGIFTQNAYPEILEINERAGGFNVKIKEGLTKREYMAVKIASCLSMPSNKLLAEKSVQIADQLLLELNKDKK